MVACAVAFNATEVSTTLCGTPNAEVNPKPAFTYLAIDAITQGLDETFDVFLKGRVGCRDRTGSFTPLFI